jgi:ATP-dependent helicase HrpA
MDPKLLPVNRHRERILEALASNQVIVVESPTGSGKTTQLPLILYKAGYHTDGLIGVTQPRRIAAVSVSEYIRRQLDATAPDTVAYKMRFEDTTGTGTRIKIMTDGILLQELKADPMLSSYSTIMIDEAHERSLNIDFILGLLKRILRQRSEFRVIVSSATINAEVFSEYFDGCPIVRIDAKVFPVDIRYRPITEGASQEELIEKIAFIVDDIEDEHDEGDVLIFLTGEAQIKTCVSRLERLPTGGHLHLLPLYARLSKDEQDRVFSPVPGKRKIIVSTNLAETSITIDGVRWVIDSGLSKVNFYNAKTFTASLVEKNISRASCNQRSGRAGRTAPGICYRLYEKSSYQNRELFTTEEIYRTDLSEVVLRMSELGIYNFESFDFISPPSIEDIRGAIETLKYLGAIETDRSLSPIGEMMARFPLLPRQSRIIVDAIHRHPDVIADAIVAAAFLSAKSPFLLPRGEEIEARRKHHRFRSDHGDFVSYLILLKAYRDSNRSESFCNRHYLDPRVMSELDNICIQLEEIVSAIGVPIGTGGSRKDYLCSVATGLVQFVCRRAGKRAYRSATAERVTIHPGSVMFQQSPEYIVAGEIVQTSRMFARSVSPIDPSWLNSISPLLKQAFSSTDYQKTEKQSRKDTSWQLEIGNEKFQIKPWKGKKKLVVLPWNRFRPLYTKKLIPPWLPDKDLRATIVHRDKEFFSGYRLKKILSLLEYVNPDRDYLPNGIRTTNIRFAEDRNHLLNALSEIGKLASVGKSNKAGFVTLHTDGSQFWQKVHRALGHATAESLSSLEVLADLIEHDDELEKKANEAYRRLDALLNR